LLVSVCFSHAVLPCSYSQSNSSAAEAVMTSVRDTIATYPFKFEHREQQVRILSGVEEGTFDWIASNYLSGSLGVCVHSTGTHTHTQLFNGPLSRTTQVSRYQKGKTNLDFTEARDSEWQWHQLGNMQVCTSLQTDNHASIPPFNFYTPCALPAAQPTAS